MDRIKASEITPEHLVSRRSFLAGAGALAVGALASACGIGSESPGLNDSPISTSSPAAEPVDTLTSYQSAIGYNNFYEFSLEKEDVASLAREFKTTPWTVQVTGLVRNPRTYGIEDILKQFPQDERIYRHRCVEGWSMVIPWMGFSLSKLLLEADPDSKARYVRFQTLLDPEQMPGQKSSMFSWPYIEGLRLDEAMHDLTTLATGLYGKPSLPQSGAPLRLVVPWKYGFKGIKSIVKIDLVELMPVSFWMSSSPDEYGFYANVNPNVAHPRWSQSTERRIGEARRRRTRLFNGYAEEVAALYSGMDLRANF